MDTSLPTVICAWCDRLLRHGRGGISHGICSDCAGRMLRSFPPPRARARDGGLPPAA